MPSNIRAAEKHLLDAGDRALRTIAEDLLGRSQRIVLLDEGTLAASGHLEPSVGVEQLGNTHQVTVRYSTPYAARRHEETNITPSVPGRQPKYLETPLKEMAARYRAALEAAVAGSI